MGATWVATGAATWEVWVTWVAWAATWVAWATIMINMARATIMTQMLIRISMSMTTKMSAKTKISTKTKTTIMATAIQVLITWDRKQSRSSCGGKAVCNLFIFALFIKIMI